MLEKQNLAGLLAPLLVAVGAFGCSHARSAPEAALGRLSVCLPRAIHLEMAIGLEDKLSPEELRKAHFNAYYESFLDAREQQKYIDCLKKDRPPNYKQDLKKAQTWLETSQRSLARSEAFFPVEQRIQDVQESFLYPDDKTFIRRVVVTLKNGTQSVEENKYDKTAPK